MAGSATRTIAAGAFAVLLASGCSGKTDSGAVVRAADLQKSLVAQLAEAGTPSTWVDCPKDLPGKVGATARCDVKFGADNTVTALLTTTQVSGDKVSWEITGPQLTKDQVSQRVAGLAAAQSADCDSGLDGRLGAWVHCRVTKNGMTFGETVEVKDVKGLSLVLSLTPMLAQVQVEDSVLAKATPLFGRRPESARCPGGLAGVPGTKISCVVMLGDNPETVVVTVTASSGSSIDFSVTRPTAGEPEVGIDYCHGCPG